MRDVDLNLNLSFVSRPSSLDAHACGTGSVYSMQYG